jgi:uncharacterized protein (TIGR02266 family)
MLGVIEWEVMAGFAEGGDNGRGAPRVPVSMLVQYRFDTLEAFAAEYAVDLSTTGIFVHTDDPRKVGSMVYLQITLKDGSKLIEGFGRVARVGRDERGQAGMGIQFINFDDESMALIERLVAQNLEPEG